MGWNPVVVDVGDVPSIDVSLAEVAEQADKIQITAKKFPKLATTLRETWQGLELQYRTSHTQEVIDRMEPAITRANRAEWVYTDLAWTLGAFVDELRACNVQRDALVKDVRRFLKIPEVQIKAVVVVMPEFDKNIALLRRTNILRGRIQKAKDKCKAQLDAIGEDGNANDPYDGTTHVTEQGAAWGASVDVTTEDLHWPLYGGSGKPSGSQVDQGSLGDCWFMSSLAALADKNPDAIERMVHDNGNGTYSVTLCVDGKWQAIQVDGTMLMDGDHPRFAGDSANGKGANNDHALWPLLVEKAAIKAYGGDYAALNAGTGAMSMELFTGNRATTELLVPDTHIGAIDHASIAQYSAQSQDPNVIMTANSKLGSTEKFDVPVEFGDDSGTVTFSNNHVYQISEIHPDGSVTLVNPWNDNPTTGAGVDHDTFTISADRFHDLFMCISIGAIN